MGLMTPLNVPYIIYNIQGDNRQKKSQGGVIETFM